MYRLQTPPPSAAQKIFDDLTTLDDHWLKCRQTVIDKKKPRNVWVQAHTYVDKNGQAQLLDFAASPQGMFLSMQYHFADRYGKTRKSGTKTTLDKLMPDVKQVDLYVKVLGVTEEKEEEADKKRKKNRMSNMKCNAFFFL